ncbi:ABC transporter permease subunit, partial [Turicibacter sanguinis]|nr:ABC transporter permease subunit [Turicibacter sanguinis]
LHIENYANAWSTANMGSYFFNSILVSVMGVLFSLCLAVPAAYCLSRYRFFASKFIMFVFSAGLFIQATYVLVPLFSLLKDLNLLDNLVVLALIYATSSLPFTIFLLSSFIRGVSRSYEEAAVMDGANRFQIMTKVIMPLIQPGIVTIVIFNFMAYWNEFPMAFTFILDDAKKTLPIGLQNLMEVQRFSTDWGALFAGMVIVLIPIVIIYAILNEKLTEGVNVGGIKG